jgi:predicted transcriptional regulator
VWEKALSDEQLRTRMVNTERDSESGKLTEQYTDEEFLDPVAEYEPASTREVAESVGCSRRNADVRLKKLEEAGEIRKKKVGNSLTWFSAE